MAALTLYSTVVSQVTLTCGGSRIEGALGSMLAETLPFLRSIATAIQKELGPGHPGVLPTTMVAYASTSVLLGAVFFALAALRCGRLTGYFPRTVMTGVVGKSAPSGCCGQTDRDRRRGCFTLSPRARDHPSFLDAPSEHQYAL